jgi:hypothetical protein
MEAPQNRRFYFEVLSSSHLAYLHRWKEDNTCQSIWDKSEVLWRTCWGTYWEPVGNLNATCGNALGTREEWKKILPTPNLKGGKKKQGTLSACLGLPIGCTKKNPSHPKLKRKNKKSKAPWVHAWAFPLAAWIFSSQKS